MFCHAAGIFLYPQSVLKSVHRLAVLEHLHHLCIAVRVCLLQQVLSAWTKIIREGMTQGFGIKRVSHESVGLQSNLLGALTSPISTRVFHNQIHKLLTMHVCPANPPSGS